MRVAIRYQSRGGHVKEMAEIIAEGAEVEPISIDDSRAPIKKHLDVLFIGGALYKFKLDPSMEEYIANIPEGMVDRAVVFGSSALTRRPIFLMQERLKARGIEIYPMGMYMRGKPKPYLHEIGPGWAARELRKIKKEIEEGKDERAPIEILLDERRKKKEKAVAEIAADVVADIEDDLEAEQADDAAAASDE